jgi:hypothetical protein
VLAAVEFADASPEPALDTMYESLYALTEYPGGWYAVDERSPEPHRGEHEADMPAAARELAEAGAAYAEVEEEGERPNPAVHGDAQDGTASRVGGDADLGAEDQPERFGAEGEAAARAANDTEERED